jgi:uncharacterized glyoxalase superfamily protein PhnB
MVGPHAGLHGQYARGGRHRLAAAVAAGATPVADATDRSWGGRSAFIADPEGNRWEITWSPRATFDARRAAVLGLSRD